MAFEEVEELDSVLFYEDNKLSDELLDKLIQVWNNYGLIILWEEGYYYIVKYILLDLYEFNTVEDVRYLHIFKEYHYDDEFKNEYHKNSLPFAYVILGKEKTIDIIIEEQLSSTDSIIFMKYFGSISNN
jgi:hypothetical protein